MPPGDTAAHDVSVEQVIALLDDRFPGLVDLIADGKYAFWIGSGISRARLPDLKAVVAGVLNFLQEHVDPDDDACQYRSALDNALSLAQLSAIERADAAQDVPMKEWAVYDTLLMRIAGRYSELLDIPIGSTPDYILWDIIDVRQVYGDIDTEPDTEHLCLAILSIEGAVSEILSANWDGLIEKATADLSAPLEPSLAVQIIGEDFRGSNGRVRLLKFHGCAVKAAGDEHSYRRYLVGRRTQIIQWPYDSEHELMRSEMRSLAATRRTLMIGLSAQDTNIQSVFSAARQLLPWQWPTTPPAFVFAEDQLGPDQRSVLRVGYGDSYIGHQAEIEQASLLRAYGKPLLVALVLSVWGRKAAQLARMAQLEEEILPLDAIEAAIAGVISTVAASMDTTVGFMRAVIGLFTHTMTLFRSGDVPQPSDPLYSVLSPMRPGQMAGDANIAASGLPAAAVALILLQTGAREGTWRLSASVGEAESSFGISLIGGSGLVSRLLFAATETVAVELELNGHVEEGDPSTVVIQSSAGALRKQRAPVAAPGRTGAKTTRRIDMSAVIAGGDSFDDLMMRFREDLAQ